jgi:hypothetical protein
VGSGALMVRRGATAIGIFMIGVALLVAFASPAYAVGSTYANPSACSASVNNGVCISEVTASVSGSTLTLTMTVGKATNPNTDSGWKDGPTASNEWAIFVNGMSTFSYFLTASDYSHPALTLGPYVGDLIDNTDLSILCTVDSGVTTSADLATNTYSATVPTRCLGNPTSIEVKATWSYDVNGTLEIAAAPSATEGPCCELALSGSPATTTPSSTAAIPTTVPTSSAVSGDGASLAQTGPSSDELQVTFLFGVTFIVLGSVAPIAIYLRDRRRTR